MRRCELCGAEAPEDAEACPRCGFEFSREIRADARDGALLERHRGKAVKVVRRDLRDRQARMRAYLENLRAKSLSAEEIVTLVNESLGFLQLPLDMGVEDVLAFDDDEADFIKLLAAALEDADRASGGPAAPAGTYVKLCHALQFLNQPDRAMDMAEKALLINPRDRSALMAKATLLFSQRKYPQARRCLEKLVAEREDLNATYLIELIDQMGG